MTPEQKAKVPPRRDQSCDPCTFEKCGRLSLVWRQLILRPHVVTVDKDGDTKFGT
jgi:hypothetical protein